MTEFYILDSLYRRSQIIENHDSMIWTERLRSVGDFQLVVNSTSQNRSRYTSGILLGNSGSRRVMVAETVEKATAADGTATIKITGRSLEKILDDRLARDALSDLTTEPKWVVTDKPADIARTIYNTVCTLGALDDGDIIPGVIEGSTDLYPTDTIEEPADVITFEMDIATVYAAIKQLCDVYRMGFRLIKDGDTSQLYFDVYMGCDRTSAQTTFPAVVFSEALDSLQNVSELSSIALNKNVAYVISAVGSEIVYAQDIDPDIAGFDRRVLVVKADDINDPDPDVASAQMIQRGRETLAQNRNVSAFDGEISTLSAYVYERNYNLGDLVELQSDDGASNKMRVTEQIFISDKEGDRSYPTLEVEEFVTPGSWDAQPADLVWDDVDPDLDWEDMP